MHGTLLSQLSLLVLLGGSAVAVNLNVDTNWRKFTNNRPKSERIRIAQNAIDRMYQSHTSDGLFSGIGHWQSAGAYSAMAILDQVTSNAANKNRVISNIKTVYSINAFDPNGVRMAAYNDDALWWAQAAVYGYKKYNDKALLDAAVATWNKVSKFVITSSNKPVKNFSIKSTCNGATMNGAVLWRPTADDQNINSITTGLFMTLSAFLAEITKDSKYKNAAILSAKWIEAHNLNSKKIVLDSVNAKDCSRSPDTWIFTYNSGKFIEGLAVLRDVTGNSHWSNLMLEVTGAAVKNTPKWQGKNGIITEGANNKNNNDGIAFKAVLIRGLLEAFRRNASNDKLRILIHSYVDVQYNALLDLAGKDDFYSADWDGPASSSYTSWGQLAALDVLVAAVDAN